MSVNFENLRERINVAKAHETADWFSLLRDVSTYLNCRSSDLI